MTIGKEGVEVYDFEYYFFRQELSDQTTQTFMRNGSTISVPLGESWRSS